MKVKVAQVFPTLCDPMDYTVRGILQARILEWVAFPFSRGSCQPGDWTQVSHIAGGFFTSWATREVNTIFKNQHPIPTLYYFRSLRKLRVKNLHPKQTDPAVIRPGGYRVSSLTGSFPKQLKKQKSYQTEDSGYFSILFLYNNIYIRIAWGYK